MRAYFAIACLALTTTEASSKINPNVTLILPVQVVTGKYGWVSQRRGEKMIIEKVEDEVMHHLLNLSTIQSGIMQAVIGANLISGTLYRYLLFKQVTSQITNDT